MAEMRNGTNPTEPAGGANPILAREVSNPCANGQASGGGRQPANVSQLAEVRLPESFWRESQPREPRAPHNYAPRVIGGFTPVIRADSAARSAIDRLLDLAAERNPLRAEELRAELGSCLDAAKELDTLVAWAEAELATTNQRIEAENAALEPELKGLQQALEEAEAELRQAHQEAAEACGQIGVGYNPEAPSLEAVLATPVDLAAAAASPLLPAVKPWIDALAAIACGPVLGVALAHFTGFITANAIANVRFAWPQVLVAVLLGITIYAGWGVGIGWAAKQTHHQIDLWRRGESGGQFARWHVIVALSFLLALLAVGVLVEGTAFRILFLEQIQRKVANGELTVDEIPHVAAGIFYLAGALLGMAFLLQKFGFCYHQAEVNQRERENRIEAAARLQAWRSSDAVQVALAKVSGALKQDRVVAERRAAVEAVEARRQARREGFDPHTEGRIEDARAQAVLPAARLYSHLEALVEELEEHAAPLPVTTEVWSRTPRRRWRWRWPALAACLAVLALTGLLTWLVLL